MSSQTLALSVSVLSLLLFGLITGFFYAFSVDVMRGLDLLAPKEAISAMQAINSAVRNPVFFVTFFLTPVLGVISAIILYKTGNAQAAKFMAGASLVYVLGAFIPTVAVNVPMNESLAALKATDPGIDAQRIWQDYSDRWTFWNTFRTIASLFSLAFAALSLVRLGNI